MSRRKRHRYTPEERDRRIEVIGPNIKRLRMERGWTQRQLAERMGRRQPDVSQWESGRMIVNDEVLGWLSNAFEVDSKELTKEVKED